MTKHTTMHHENLARIARVEGQIKGVKRMIESGEYCVDIINQIQAASAALQSVSRVILEKHLKTCVAGTLEDNKTSDVDEKIEEIMLLMKRMSK